MKINANLIDFEGNAILFRLFLFFFEKKEIQFEILSEIKCTIVYAVRHRS